MFRGICGARLRVRSRSGAPGPPGPGPEAESVVIQRLWIQVRIAKIREEMREEIDDLRERQIRILRTLEKSLLADLERSKELDDAELQRRIGEIAGAQLEPFDRLAAEISDIGEKYRIDTSPVEPWNCEAAAARGGGGGGSAELSRLLRGVVAVILCAGIGGEWIGGSLARSAIYAGVLAALGYFQLSGEDNSLS